MTMRRSFCARVLLSRAILPSLNEWTTAVHRDNARHSLLFHAGDLPPTSQTNVKQADAFVATVARLLDRKARPHRGHPYWHGAMAAFYEAKGARLNKEEWRFALGTQAARKLADQMAPAARQICAHGSAAAGSTVASPLA